MDKDILSIYSLLQEIAWQFGNHGINGECCGDISLAEFMALKKVYENKSFSIQDIGNAINFTKSGATRIINRLEDKGYVARERSSIDGRVCCVSITAKGTKVIIRIMKENTIYLEKMLKDLESTRVESIKEALEILVKSLHKR